MRNWIVIVAGIVLALLLLALAFKSVTLDLFFNAFVDEPEPATDGEAWRAKITSFADGTGPADRDFLILKLQAFSAAAQETHFARLAYKYYYEEFEKMAEDGTLNGRENTSLRELYSEVLSEETIEKWHREGGKLVIGEE